MTSSGIKMADGPQTDSQQQQQSAASKKQRHKFNVKYFGSALLHKNFTLPMLEWIAKDIKRQTVKGAQSLSLRQFSIPARDIVFEIQSKNLTAISCKGGHCIFVHPMQCVSRYVQLQHDATCFAYIIRDSKDSPSFAHVFQAKSANKVHDIFTVIREVTTRPSQQPCPLPSVVQQSNSSSIDNVAAASSTASSIISNSFAQTMNRLQKSASTDGHWKSLLGGRHIVFPIPSKTTQNTDSSAATAIANNAKSSALKQQVAPSASSISSTTNAKAPAAPLAPARTASTLPTSIQQAKNGPASTSKQDIQQQRQQQQQNAQFENSYQFEVLFVKRVKLQCRRVPVSFVDDALETLKSFEVLKSNVENKSQIKNGVGKRIISASVDERQEYDESCQTPAVAASKSLSASSATRPETRETSLVINDTNSLSEDKRRGSSVSLGALTTERHEHQRKLSDDDDKDESRSCHQSPKSHPKSIGRQESADHQTLVSSDYQKAVASSDNLTRDTEVKKHHQSIDCLRSIDCTIRSARLSSDTPTYTSDFSPYNTITSTDLNERIAAIPVVSGSVSLDHETRQRLARQVRETIMATAANIKKGVYASGDKLDSSSLSSCKALDSLSCNKSSPIPLVDDGAGENKQVMIAIDGGESETDECNQSIFKQRKQKQQQQQQQQQQQVGGNNFDLFRRASGRQNIKNRTMLLLIGKDELCAISIENHQLLFNKSFNSIVHCLQGHNNKDHFGLICRDSGKINPNTDSYAGFVFKCQSEKVVREIMGALKQVIYHSQNNYHGYNSPYNPLNQYTSAVVTTSAGSVSSVSGSGSSVEQTNSGATIAATTSGTSLANRRGFANAIEMSRTSSNSTTTASSVDSFDGPQTNQQLELIPKPVNESIDTSTLSASGRSFVSSSGPAPQMTTATTANSPSNQKSHQSRSTIKMMFCDDCPLYWYHRLCCDIKLLPAEASKTIILRRIDSSLSEKEQDEIYSRFSEFDIESIDEHNEIFMSLLRHQCERKQLKHYQSQAHTNAMAKSAANERQSHSLSTAPCSSTSGANSGKPNESAFRFTSSLSAATSSTSIASMPATSSNLSSSSTIMATTTSTATTITKSTTVASETRKSPTTESLATKPSSNSSATVLWDRLLQQEPTKKVDFVEVTRMVRLGVPKKLRGEIWMFLMNQYQLRHGTSFQPADSEFHGDANQNYRSLLSQLSTQQHEILVDIGRTFPTHPYYSQYLGIGQLSLFNLLKAYSLLDPEVGYCQGLSFVAGVLLLHVDSEDEAFELMRHLLFNFGLRKQYLPSMKAFHLQLYQMTRLLRDHEYNLYNHFDRHNISPSLYAAPWFLTLFASQFPLGFVARLLDLIFLIGIEAIFRVLLKLLAHHRPKIIECHSLESTMEYMRTELVRIDDRNLAKIFDGAMILDLRNELIEYEIEYSFHCAEDKARSLVTNDTGGQQTGSSKKKTASNSSSIASSESSSSGVSTSAASTSISMVTPRQLADVSQLQDKNEEAAAKDVESDVGGSCSQEVAQDEDRRMSLNDDSLESTSRVADATATVIIQHLLANNHLRSLRSDYTY